MNIKTPDYVIPATGAGFVAYPEKRIAGLQFADPNGNMHLIAMPAEMIRSLARGAAGLLEEMPEIAEWGEPSVPGTTPQ